MPDVERIWTTHRLAVFAPDASFVFETQTVFQAHPRTHIVNQVAILIVQAARAGPERKAGQFQDSHHFADIFHGIPETEIGNVIRLNLVSLWIGLCDLLDDLAAQAVLPFLPPPYEFFSSAFGASGCCSRGVMGKSIAAIWRSASSITR